MGRGQAGGLNASGQGPSRRGGDAELEVKDMPPPMSEEALTTVVERSRQGIAASEAADGAGANPTLEGR